MEMGDTLSSRQVACAAEGCGRPASELVMATLFGPVTFQVCSNCDHRTCSGSDCVPIIDPFVQNCPTCGVDIRLDAA